MKFSFRQILASAAGAVVAALIASSFGVTGTIIGVAIGSMAATIGTAVVSQSIERGHQAVKQVVVRVPEGPTSSLLRRLGGTGAAGGATSSVDGAPKEPAPTEVVGALDDETTQIESHGAAVDATERLEVSTEVDALPTEQLAATTAPLPPTAVVDGAGVATVTGAAGVARAAGTDDRAGGRRFTWKAIAGTVAVVFIVALAFVTVVEVIADRPLSSIFGHTGSGPTLKNIFTPSSPTTSTTTTSSTTTTAPSATTTSTSSTGSSTTTTSSTTPSSTTTTTTNPGATTTTTPATTTTTVTKP